MTDIRFIENISSVFKRLSHAAMRAGRSLEDIKLIAVTKTVPVESIKDAINAGLRTFGENRVQEAKDKISILKSIISDSKIEWHLVGHLQKNKARYAVELFDYIQSVDSIELAEIINKQAEKTGKIQKILLQVKLVDEPSKSGILKDKLTDILSGISVMKYLSIQGLMTIPPFFDDPEMSRPYFRQLRELKDKADSLGFRLPELSMGMTNDFEVAIEEGATMVRIGTAIFGERNN